MDLASGRRRVEQQTRTTTALEKKVERHDRARRSARATPRSRSPPTSTSSKTADDDHTYTTPAGTAAQPIPIKQNNDRRDVHRARRGGDQRRARRRRQRRPARPAAAGDDRTTSKTHDAAEQRGRLDAGRPPTAPPGKMQPALGLGAARQRGRERRPTSPNWTKQIQAAAGIEPSRDGATSCRSRRSRSTRPRQKAAQGAADGGAGGGRTRCSTSSSTS